VFDIADCDVIHTRQFYLTYHGQEKLQPLVGEISWAKHLGNHAASLGRLRSYPQLLEVLLNRKPGCETREFVQQVAAQIAPQGKLS